MKNSDKPPTDTFLNINANVTLNGEAIDYYPLLYRQTVLDKSWKKDNQKKQQFSLLKRLKVQVVSDLDWCADLWNEFSPHKSLFDTWDFRYAFYAGYKNDPYFLTLFLEDEPVGVLPLWYEAKKQKYFWFGSWWQEDNTFFVKDEIFAPLLIALAPKPLFLTGINIHGKNQLNGTVAFEDDDPKFTLRTDRLNSLDDYLNSLKKKKRYNIKRDIRIIESHNPKIITNNFSDYSTMVQLTKRRFAMKGEEVDFKNNYRIKQFRQVIKLGLKHRNYEPRMITVMINNRVAAVDLVVIYKNIYYALRGGLDVKRFPGIGSFMNSYEIEEAISFKSKRIDFLAEDCGWKHTWFKSTPLYSFKKE